MRVLQICSKPPLPAKDGGCLASYQLSKNLLKAGFDLTLVTLATEKHPYLPNEIDQQYSSAVNLEVVSVSTAFKPVSVFFNLFENKSIQERRFYHSHFADKLVSIIKKQDVDFVLFDGLLSCVYEKDVRKASRGKMIYRSHNVEYSILDQRKEFEKNPFRKFYLGMQSARLMRFEMSKWNSMEAVFSISSTDIDAMMGTGISPVRTEVLPFNLEVNESEFTPKKNSLFHLGAMDWEPNVQGVNWFVKEVWPLVHKSHPHCELHLGGKNISRVKEKIMAEGIHIHEVVSDADSFAGSFDILIVPLHEGSGTRIKVLQSMARGNVIVSTEKGMQGIEAENDKNVLIAKDATTFAACLEKLFTNNELKDRLRVEAKKLIQEHYNPDALSEKLKTWMIQL